MQEYLEELTNVSLISISRIENGHTDSRISTLEKIAKALGVHISDLFNEIKIKNLKWIIKRRISI